MYALDDIVHVDVPYAVLNAAAGYEAGNKFQGFLVMDPERSQRVVDAMGAMTVSAASSLRFGTAPSTPTAHGKPYQPANESSASKPTNPHAKDPNEIDRYTIGHAKTQNALEAYAKARGWNTMSPKAEPHYDVAWDVGGMLFVAEVKSLTAANEAKQVRLAIGQVLDYQQMLASLQRPVRPVIALEMEPASNRWEAICARHGITLVWPKTFGRLATLATSVSEAS